MARPTDPEKLAALRARERKNQQARRDRLKAGTANRYSSNGRLISGYTAPPINAITRARDAAATARAKKDEILRSLPSIRNPEAEIYVPQPVKRAVPELPRTAAGVEKEARIIREHERRNRLENFGRTKKQQLVRELQHGKHSGALKRNMDKEQQERFQALSERIASGSMQSVGILFQHEGGQGDYNSIFSRLIYPGAVDVEESLERLENLADMADKAKVAYAPSKIGRIRV